MSDKEPLDFTRKLQTLGGCKFTPTRLDAPGKYPVVGFWEESDEIRVGKWKLDGTSHLNTGGGTCFADLVYAPVETVVYVNGYKAIDGSIEPYFFLNKPDAENHANSMLYGKGRVCCIRVVLREGQFDE